MRWWLPVSYRKARKSATGLQSAPLAAALAGNTTLRCSPFIEGFFRQVFLLEPQKEPKRVPLLPIAREARLKGAWVRALRERFASAPLRIQERTDWPLPAANALRLDGLQFLLLVSYPQPFVGGRDIWPRRGQSVGRRKSVKKNAALLHFLAFPSSDHLFGVPRGEQPLGRASRAVGSSGHFFGSFLVSKRNT